MFQANSKAIHTYMGFSGGSRVKNPPAKIHEPMVTLSSTREARIYNGKKIASLTSGAGKIGQPLVKE